MLERLKEFKEENIDILSSEQKEVINTIIEIAEKGEDINLIEKLEEIGINICYDCNNICFKNDMFYVNDGDLICENCKETNYTVCDCCGKLVEESDATYIEYNNEYYCIRCVDEHCSSCDRCGEICTNEDMANVRVDENSYQDYCPHCVDSHTFYCEECDQRCDDDIYESDDECQYCHEERGESDSYIEDYDFTPYHLHFFKNDDEVQPVKYFGFELEVDRKCETPNKMIPLEYIKKHYDNIFYMKHDGSLSDGFEIVSHPATINFWLDKKQTKTLENIFKKVKDGRLYSHDTETCGLHIHVSRLFFGENYSENDRNVNKLLYITEKFKRELMLFSRRKSYSYTQFLSDSYRNRSSNEIDVVENAEQVKIMKEYIGRDKYQVINTNHSETIEFRLCRGTLHLQTFLASLQMFNNMCFVAKNMSEEDITNMTFKDLVTYNKYEDFKEDNIKELVQYCFKKHLIKEEEI